MTHVALTNPALFEVFDETAQTTHCGSDQNWFGTEWQRLSGCGPSVASNILFYRSLLGAGDDVKRFCVTRQYLLSLMEEVWNYVTPTKQGIPTTELFCRSFLAYAEEKKIGVAHCASCDVRDDETNRPSLPDIIAFLETALRHDRPVAFLNLCNGDESNLDRWHWVTVIALEYDSEENATIRILDEGLVKQIDLALWYRTTTLGGGFVCFDFSFPADGH